MKTRVTHEHLHSIKRVLPTDYADYGGEIKRWATPGDSYPDCSMGCIWAAWLEGKLSGDWCVCAKPNGPRAGLLTFEHQAGYACFEGSRRRGDGKDDQRR